jgi:hypothetical protein
MLKPNCVEIGGNVEKLPPFMNSVGLIGKIFSRIQEAKEPDDRYTQNFQEAVLGYGSGQAKNFIPFLKRMGFLEPDGRPTSLYRKFRNPDTAGTAMAAAMRIGFKDIFDRNEYAYKLGDEKLKNLIVEMTGKDKNSTSVQKIAASFKACKSLADFEGADADGEGEIVETPPEGPAPQPQVPFVPPMSDADVKMSFGYTINLNLPNTDDPKVFNAIFASLKETLLKQ